MKLYKISLLAFGALFTLSSCNDIDEQMPAGGELTGNQLESVYQETPSRQEASFNGMFTMMGQPDYALNYIKRFDESPRPDDAGFFTIHFSDDLEGADMFGPNTNYNWFSAASELSTRNANYANPYIRYVIPFKQIGLALSNISTLADTVMIAQSRAVRAYDYMTLAPHFCFSTQPDSISIPILTDTTDYAHNPRQSFRKIMAIVMEDLDFAVEHLQGVARTDKSRIDASVAYGLRARANLLLGKYAEAAADADKAMQGYTPASIEEVSKPAFCDLNEHNWMWGVSIPKNIAEISTASTPASWICSFSGDAYSAGGGVYAMINVLLYNKISATDVRKGWWLNENNESPLLNGLVWTDTDKGISYTGQEIVDATITNVKEPFLGYTNVKFGCKDGIGSTTNINDWPLMRVEEMYLIKAEGLAKSNQVAQAKQVLSDFVKTYRDPAYDINSITRSLEDEIWFQRRVELWGEGFFTIDAKRLGKNIVRFHDNKPSNVPDAFKFNIKSNDPWLNMRFPSTEMDNNLDIIDNVGGTQPEAGQNPELRDGVTD